MKVLCRQCLSLLRWHLFPHSVPFLTFMPVLRLVAVLLRVLVPLVFVLLTPVRISIPVPVLLIRAIPLAAPLANPICTCIKCSESASKARQSRYSQLQRQNKQALCRTRGKHLCHACCAYCCSHLHLHPTHCIIKHGKGHTAKVAASAQQADASQYSDKHLWEINLMAIITCMPVPPCV